jgi:spermidine synthase
MPTLVAIFFISGASGLIYQVAWVRLLSLTFGVTLFAVSVVVGTFMGGLALGAYVGGRLADRLERPVLGYALAEIGIAALGALSPAALSWAHAAYVAVHPGIDSGAGVASGALRFGLAALTLLPPATLMGATLPLIVRGSLGAGGAVGSRVAWLYASNTAGAIIGTLGAGFLLVGALGISGAIHVAVALNLLASVSAFVAGQFLGRAQGERGFVPSAHQGPRSRHALLVTGVFTLQGFASLAYEVIWVRVLAILLDGSSYAFAIVLAIVLLGIATGSWMVGPLTRQPLPWLQVYAALQTGVASTALLGVIASAHVYDFTGWAGGIAWLGPLVQSHYGWMVAVAALALLPGMALLGASFPIAARIVVSDSSAAGRGLGALYAGNTAAAILGTWVAGFLLIPALGTQRSLELMAGLNAALALALALGTERRRAATAGAVVAVIAACFVAEAILAGPMVQRIAAGRFPEAELVWFGEGREMTVTVARDHADGHLEMFLNDQSQASDDPQVAGFHRLLGQIPMVLHPNPRDVLIVGLGGGATAGALAQHSPSRLDVVELSDAVVQGATYFDHINGGVLRRPNVHLRIDDGRNHLLLSGRQYDVITADVINPRNAGSALVYSYEYYALARRALKPGGIMAQWLEQNPANPDNDAQRRLMARTFLAAFPHVTLWANGALMIGSERPLDLGPSSLAARWAPDGRNVGRYLEGTDIDSPGALLALYAQDDTDLRRWAGDGPLITDDHPYTEYFLSLPGGSRTQRWAERLWGF